MRRLALAVVFGIALGAVAPVVHAEPPKTHEILTDRPSGFWTSNRPAVGGPYRTRLLLLGCAIALTTGWLTWRLIRRANAQRGTMPRATIARGDTNKSGRA